MEFYLNQHLETCIRLMQVFVYLHQMVSFVQEMVYQILTQSLVLVIQVLVVIFVIAALKVTVLVSILNVVVVQLQREELAMS